MGLVGANLVPKLLERGFRVRALLHNRNPDSALAGVEYATGDLTSPADCARLVAGQELVVHLAARGASATGFNRGNGLGFLQNFFMDSHLLAAAQEAGVKKVVWLGSSTAYPPTGERPASEDDLFSGEPFEKYYEVGWFKRFTEVLCRIYATRSRPRLSVGVLRPTAIYGPHDDFNLATCHVIPALVRKVVERWSPLEVWGTGGEERDFVFAGDVADAIITLLERLEGYAAYNVGAGTSCTIREVIGILTDLDGFADAKIKFEPTKPTTIPVRRVSIARALQDLGWQPRTSLKEGLRQTLQWYRHESTQQTSGH